MGGLRTITGKAGSGPTGRLASATLVLCVCLAGSVLAAPSAAATSCSGGKCSVPFSATGSLQEWQVPNGVTSATFAVKGAGGGAPDHGVPHGGSGAKVTSTLALAEKAKLKLVVGVGGTWLFGGEAYGGGGRGADPPGSGGGGGGGGSFVFSEGGSLLMAAGGGGGGGGYESGSSAGGNGGETGAPGQGNGVSGGGGATASAGGTAGENAHPGQGPTTSTSIQGKGGEGGAVEEGGGGGGGGLYGGGGGGSNMLVGRSGGGGGGSSVVNGGTSTTFEGGKGGAGGGLEQNGQGGEVAISFSQPTMSVAVLASSETPAIGEPVTYTATVSPVPTSGTVAFEEGGLPISGCGVQTVSTTTGKASCTTEYHAAGTHGVTGRYSGSLDTVYRGATSAETQTVTPSAATTTSPEASGTAAAATVKTTVIVIKATRSSSPVLLTRAPQPVINARFLTIAFRCGQAACRGRASVSIKLPGRRPWVLRSGGAGAAGGARANLRLALPARLRSAVRGYLRSHRRYRVTLDLTATMSVPGVAPQSARGVLAIWTLPGLR